MRDIKEIAEENYGLIAGSEIFLQLHNKKIAEEPIPLMQLGLAIMLDKPIALLVEEGETLPENLIKVAKAVEYYKRDDKDSVKTATEKILKKLGRKVVK